MAENTVELMGHYGGDREHAMSAWTSTSRELTQEKIDRIPKLLKMLADAGHHTPFEKSSLHFLVTTDIASHIHILKHRVGVSVNGESARYKELKEDKFYLPPDWGGVYRFSTEVEEDKNGLFGITSKGDEPWIEILRKYNELGNQLYHECIEDLVNSGISRKRAKESARFFKPYSSQITSDVMFNWRSFMHFLGLRNKPDAQLEIRQIAEKMLESVQNIPDNPFKYSLEAFGYV